MLHQAQTINLSDIFCGCYSANLHYHRRDAGKLSSCPTSFCRRSWVLSLTKSLYHLKTTSKIRTKRFMGPGETRRSRHKRDVNGGLMKNINGTKSKLSIKINSAVVS